MNTKENNYFLFKEWLKLKQLETDVKEQRQAIENCLTMALGIDRNKKGTETHTIHNIKAVVSKRQNVKIDREILLSCATDPGISEHMDHLFRWKPEINEKVWKDTHPNITNIFTPALTITPARPSYKITVIEDE